MKRIVIAPWLAALALLLAAADLPAACDLSADRITLPNGWSATPHQDFIQYRSPGAGEALTVALYTLESRRAAGIPVAAMLELAQLRRQREQELAGATLRLSALQQLQAGPALRLQYSGEDPSSRRRFVNLMLGSPDCVRNYYYEAIDLPAPVFLRQAERMLGASAPPQVHTAQRPISHWNIGVPPTVRRLETVVALP